MTIPMERVENRILFIRGHRVIVDTDLAEVYGVPTKRLNEQVKRNVERFPEDFAFRFTPGEKMELVAKCDRFARLKHSTVFPLAFTEHGAIIAASVLNSPRAIEDKRPRRPNVLQDARGAGGPQGTCTTAGCDGREV